MSILSWLLKSKKEMAKPNTKQVRIWKYKISSHAQNQSVAPTRKVKKPDMLKNLLTKPNAISGIKIDNKGRQSYNRVGKKHTTSINPKTNVVATIRPISRQDKRDYKLVKKGDKYYVNKNK